MMQPGGKLGEAIEGVKSLQYRTSQTNENYKADFFPKSLLACIKIIDPQGVNHHGQELSETARIPQVIDLPSRSKGPLSLLETAGDRNNQGVEGDFHGYRLISSYTEDVANQTRQQ
jgi:hypothetical protein